MLADFSQPVIYYICVATIAKKKDCEITHKGYNLRINGERKQHRRWVQLIKNYLLLIIDIPPKAVKLRTHEFILTETY